MAMTRKQMLEFEAEERRKQRAGLRRQDIAPAPTPESVRQSPAGLRGYNQADMIKEYEALGAELTAPNRTAETVRTAIARRSRLLQDMERDSQGRVIRPATGQANITAPPNVASQDDIRLAAGQRLGQRGIPGPFGAVARLSAATYDATPLNFIGDRFANFLTGGRVDAQQGAAVSDRLKRGVIDRTPQSPLARSTEATSALTESPAVGGTAGGSNGQSIVYRNADGSFSTTPAGEDSTVFNRGIASTASSPEAARAAFFADVPGNEATILPANNENARNRLRERTSPFAGGPVSSVPQSARDRYSQQVAAAREINSRPTRRRLSGGAAEGAGFLDQVAKMREGAIDAYNQTLRRGGNSKAAERAARAYGIGISDLVEARGDQLYSETSRYGTDARTALGYAGLDADQAYRAADLQQRYAQMDAATRQAYGDQFADELDASAERAAAAMLPRNVDPDDKDRLLGEYNIRYRANLPSNYASLNRRERAEADQQAMAYGRMLTELSDEAGFNYYSIGDLLSAGRIPQQDLSFWRSFVEDGPLDAAWGELSGRTEITLPGTTNRITVQELRSLSGLNRSSLRDVFEPVRR